MRLPIPRKNGDVVLTGAVANRLLFDYGTVEKRSAAYDALSLQLGYIKKWSDSLNTLFMLIPRISSDMKELSNEDAQLGGVVLFTRKRSEELSWKYGLYANTEFFGFFLVPLIGVDWKVNEKLRFFGTLPANMTAMYTCSDFLRLGLKFSAPAASYRLSENHNSPYLHQYTNLLFFFQDWYLTRQVVLQTQLGHSFFRYYRYYDKNDRYKVSVSGIGIGGGKREPLSRVDFDELNDGLVFQLGIVFRYDLEKN